MGVLSVLAFVAAATVLAANLARRWAPWLDPAERAGVSGALGLGVLGLLALGVGLFPGGTRLLTAVPALIVAAVGVLALVLRWRLPSPIRWDARILALAPFLALSLIGVLAPSDSRDWDSLAYHLAVPKIWLAEGRVGFVEGIHHSNFPFTADMLYLYGLPLGGQAAAKAFNLAWLALGCAAVFGIARRWTADREGSSSAGHWAALCLAGCPVVLWESGTAYIDIPHGLFSGLAVLYAADALTSGHRSRWIVAGLCLGFAMGTKHTGLQILGAIVVASLVAALLWRRPRREAGVDAGRTGLAGLVWAVALAFAIAGPWYAKSWAMTGNPVYPFFYSAFGGRDWDAWRASIYTEEQKSFGVGTSPSQLGHAVLGLAYQPGRYVNPGQQEGRGFPTGSIGFAALLAGFVLCCSGRPGQREKAVLGTVGVGLLAWFVLSQQSRYLTSIVVPLAVLAGVAVVRLRAGRLLAAGVAIQAAYSLWLVWTVQGSDQVAVATGQQPVEEYLSQRVSFYRASRVLNTLPGAVKVALYDEVFGFFLDKPYMWANPGHSTLIPYDHLRSGTEYADAMARLGFTHVYVNLRFMDRASRSRWTEAAFSPSRYSAVERSGLESDMRLWWRFLVADAVQAGRLRPLSGFPTGEPADVLFEIAK